MWKKLLFLLLVTLLACVVAFVLRLHMEQRALAAGMVRLHVTANSDEPEDQRLKLQVRDAVLPVVRELTAGSQDAAQARTALRGGLDRIEEAAREALPADRAGTSLRVRLGAENFPRRDYDTFSLPAGRYESLRIILGAGEGHNCLCVAFPSLCLPATTEGFEDAALAAGMSGDQVELVTAQTPEVRVKFRVLDWLTALFG